MRTLGYVLTKRPGTTDDCLDFAKHHQVNCVQLTLETLVIMTDMHILRCLVAVFYWQFDCLELPEVTVKEWIGGCFYLENEKWQKTSVDSANARLKKILAMLESAGIQVTGQDRQFAYDVIYT